MASADITVIKLNDVDLYFPVTQVLLGASSVYDITGCTAKFTVKQNVTDLDAAAKISASATLYSIPGGILKVALTSTNTNLDVGTYFYDLQLRDTGGKIHTVVKGNFFVEQNIRIAITA